MRRKLQKLIKEGDRLHVRDASSSSCLVKMPGDKRIYQTRRTTYSVEVDIRIIKRLDSKGIPTYWLTAIYYDKFRHTLTLMYKRSTKNPEKLFAMIEKSCSYLR